MAAQRDRALHLAVDLQVFGAGDLTLDLQARTEARKIACRGTTRASARGCAKRRCRGCGFRRRRYGRWFGLRLLLGPHTSSIIRSTRVDSAPGGRERYGFTVVAFGKARQPRKGSGLRRSNTVRADRSGAQASSDLLNSIEEADQVFPGEVVHEQRDRCGDWEGVRGEAGNGEVQKTRDNDPEWREQNGQESAVEADGELQASTER